MMNHPILFGIALENILVEWVIPKEFSWVPMWVYHLVLAFEDAADDLLNCQKILFGCNTARAFKNSFLNAANSFEHCNNTNAINICCTLWIHVKSVRLYKKSVITSSNLKTTFGKFQNWKAAAKLYSALILIQRN